MACMYYQSLPFKITDTAGVTVYRFSKLTILFNV